MDSVTVSIFGEDYTIRSGDDRDYIAEVALYLDAKMREVARSGKTVTTSKIAILAALHITDELLKTKQEQESERLQQQQRIEKMLHRLQEAIEG